MSSYDQTISDTTLYALQPLGVMSKPQKNVFLEPDSKWSCRLLPALQNDLKPELGSFVSSWIVSLYQPTGFSQPAAVCE